jgi:hypothetical protein
MGGAASARKTTRKQIPSELDQSPRSPARTNDQAYHLRGLRVELEAERAEHLDDGIEVGATIA